ncbi:MAG: hypothetical protein WBD90_23840 [Xanthobacteraceae bacterium]
MVISAVPIVISKIDSVSALLIAIGAKKNRADRPRQKRNAERAERDQERHRFVGRREEHLGDDDGEIAVDQDFVEFERIADGSRDDEPGCGAGAVRAVVSLKCRRAHRACSVPSPFRSGKCKADIRGWYCCFAA